MATIAEVGTLNMAEDPRAGIMEAVPMVLNRKIKRVEKN